MDTEGVRKNILKYAATAAKKSDYCRKQKMGAAVFFNKKVISVGCNCDKTDPIQKEYNEMYREDFLPSSIHKKHAEVAALKKLKNNNIDFSKLSIVVCRLSNMKNKEFAMARPCPACMEYIKKCGIKTIYYTTDQGFAKELLD